MRNLKKSMLDHSVNIDRTIYQSLPADETTYVVEKFFSEINEGNKTNFSCS